MGIRILGSGRVRVGEWISSGLHLRSLHNATITCLILESQSPRIVCWSFVSFFITYPRQYASVPWYFLQSCNQKASGAPGLVSVGKWAQQMALGVSLPQPWHPSMEGINRKEGQVREGCCCLLGPCCLSPCTHDC